MRRLFWVGVGVTITVVVIRRGKRLVAQYAPEAVVDRAERTAQDLGHRAETFVGAFRSEFTTARARREAELTAALLAEGQPDPDDVRASGLRASTVRPGRSAVGRHASVPRDVEAEIAADEAELGYSF
ncbi:hypothetical protein [Isoptericola variabilis]|uniref:Secreted protein n=1 Tax=Isoptericola variabilis (strain 225) TaxID=743718 RepID=F6FVF4_ISOV2|nr:hypothetical protein [Isoptericola variabilis]AEG44381.1 hypothetical protein Isova_1629 [Isoptericola variabilis 225]TWH34374.1 hypothetical protein L600_001200000300 [Isoptericola variabilis J7]